jgi:RNA polymerase sigma-70 factor (ECF subfamily)
VRFDMVNCNNAPAIVVHRGDVLEGVFLLEIVDDKITNFYAMRNPDKLSAFAVPRTISR